MDVDQVIDLESFDDDIPAVHPHFSATASATTAKSNREPLSKFILFKNKKFIRLIC